MHREWHDSLSIGKHSSDVAAQLDRLPRSLRVPVLRLTVDRWTAISKFELRHAHVETGGERRNAHTHATCTRSSFLSSSCLHLRQLQETALQRRPTRSRSVRAALLACASHSQQSSIFRAGEYSAGVVPSYTRDWSAWQMCVSRVPRTCHLACCRAIRITVCFTRSGCPSHFAVGVYLSVKLITRCNRDMGIHAA